MTTTSDTTATKTEAPKPTYELKPADGGDPLPAELATAHDGNVEEQLLAAAKLRYPNEKQVKVVRAAEGRLVVRRFFRQGQSSQLFVAVPLPPAEAAPKDAPQEPKAKASPKESKAS